MRFSKLLKRTVALTLLFASANNGIADSYWHTNYEIAETIAQAEEKPILIFFTGSDWCLWCKKLERELFAKEAFSAEIESTAVPLLLDFPQRRKLPPKQGRRNKALKAQFAIEAFPTVILFDPLRKEERLRHGYFETTPESYIETLKRAAQISESNRKKSSPIKEELKK